MKNKSTINIRIKDIADIVGVSVGTIDRILHNRGEVSEKTRKKVEKVLEEMNYKPNLLARSLASKKKYIFTCVIPTHQQNDYWQKILDGFQTAQRDFAHYNVELKIHYYDQYDSYSFEKLAKKLTKTASDAWIIAPIFKEQTLHLLENTTVSHLPFSFIDSMIEGTGFLTYYGQHSVQSGFVAAKMLDQSVAEESTVLLIRNKRKGAVSNQTVARRDGFLQYFATYPQKSLNIVDVDMSENDDVANLNLLKIRLQNDSNIRAIVTFNSRVNKIAQYLENLNFPDIQLLGYDLLESNIQYLKKGIISLLIDQRPEKQAYYTVRDICSKLIMKQEVKQINYMPIDIIIKENVDSYCQFKE